MSGDLKAHIEDLVRQHADPTEIAESVLRLRLHFVSRGLPDIMGRSHAWRMTQHAIWKAAPPWDNLRKTLSNRMNRVLVEYLRGLDHDRAEAGRHFGEALVAHPELTPTEAVYAAYADAGITLPRSTLAEQLGRRRRHLLTLAGVDDQPVDQLAGVAAALESLAARTYTPDEASAASAAMKSVDEAAERLRAKLEGEAQ